jgi:hypothetical protein
MQGTTLGSMTGAADVSGMDDSMLLSMLARAAQEGVSVSYRVGVRPYPLKDKQIGNNLSRSLFNTTAGGVSAAGSASWFAHVSSGGEKGAAVLATLKGAAVKVRPAILSVEMADEDTDFGVALDQSSGTALFVVSIRRQAGLRILPTHACSSAEVDLPTTQVQLHSSHRQAAFINVQQAACWQHAVSCRSSTLDVHCEAES